MTQAEIASLEHAGRSTMAWVPEAEIGRVHFGAVFGALVPAVAILSVAIGLLIALL